MKENVRGEGSWGTKTVKGKEYVRYQKWVGGRIRKKIEVCGKTRTECLSKMKEKERDYLEKENMGLSSVAPAENRTLVEDAMWNWLYTYKKPAMKPKSFDRIVGTYNAHVKDKRIGRTEINDQFLHNRKTVYVLCRKLA